MEERKKRKEEEEAFPRKLEGSEVNPSNALPSSMGLLVVTGLGNNTLLSPARLGQGHTMHC